MARKGGTSRRQCACRSRARSRRQPIRSKSALIQSYQNNPQLNAQRAAARVTDENVAIAVSGYRPRVAATASLGEVYLDTLTRVVELRARCHLGL